MPTVPYTPKAPSAPKIDETFAAMAAADLHDAGMLFEPSIKRGGLSEFPTDAETLDEMDAHIQPESKPRSLPGRMYDKPPKDVG